MKKYLFVLFGVLLFQTQIYSQVVFNELLSANYNGITDEDNEYSDWLELYNTTSSTINLQGYSLTDEKINLQKWQFPSYQLQPNRHLVVFASGKNRNISPLSWQTIINRGDIWKYRVPTSDIGTTWRNLSYNDDSWLQGSSGFGYGDGDDATVIPTTSVSVYIRKAFEITNLSLVKQLILHMDFDDGFVAYLNGIEVARSNLGTPGSSVAYNALASDHEARIYQGLSPESYDISQYVYLLKQGNNVLAVECHNASTSSTDLTIIPFLTLGIDDAQGSNNVHPYFAPLQSTFHTNFKIDKTAEVIYLVNTAGVIIDSISAILDGDVSYGCQPDGTKNYFYFATPTPGQSNNNSVTASNVRADSVQFSKSGGYYSGGTSVILMSPNINDKIYYTLDGSIPSESSTLYTSQINITKDIVVRARTYSTGKLPGPVVTNSYIVSKNHKFPIISFSTDPKNLWDYYTGIYVMGPNAESSNPYFGANFWQDWEKPAQLEMYDANKQNVINQTVGIKIYGAWTRANPQKSFAVFARKSYGKGSLEYRFFDDKPIKKFEALVTRNSGNDANFTMFRDGFITGLTRKMDTDRMGFKPSATYINGEYWGILNIREKINEHFLADNHLFDNKDLTLLTNDGEVVMGTNDDYFNLLGFINGNNLQTAANYEQVLNRMDIDNYIQYMLTQIYADNTDWPGNNIKFWRTQSPKSKWRWILYDTDFGFGLYNTNAYNNNTFNFVTQSSHNNWPNPAWSTLLFRRLLTSTQFRNNFITQYSDHLNTTFVPANVNAQVDSLKNLFEGEIQHHIARWNLNYSNWLYEVGRLKTFSNARPAVVWSQMQSFFNLGTRYPVQVSANDFAQGTIKLNSITLNQSFSGTYFSYIPISLKALPKPGYKFVNWEGNVPSTEPTISFGMQSSPTFKANFTLADASDINIVINEINFKSASTFNTDDWVELYNNGKATVDLGGWELTDLGKEERYVFPAGTILYPGDYIVVNETIRKFRDHQPNVKNSIGNFKFGLSSSGDKIRLYNNAGKLIDAVDYFVGKPWPVVPEESGATLELIHPKLDNTLGANWVLNTSNGTPGKQNLGYNPTVNIKEPSNGLFGLSCFPNPFSDYTTVEIAIPDTNQYTINVLDVNGRTIYQLLNQNLTPDTYYFDWKGIDESNKKVASGVYFIKCSSSSYSKTIKVIKIN